MTVTAGFSSGLLTVTGDSGANLVSIFTQVDNGTAYVVVQDNGVTIFDGRPTGANITSAAVQSIAVSGADGDDVLHLSLVSPATGFSAVTSVSLSGGAGNDTIIGSAFNNSMLGGDGADALYSGAGNDSLDGGNDSDYYVFAGLQLGSDAIAAAPDSIGDILHFREFEAGITINLSDTSQQTVSSGNLQLTLASDNAIAAILDTAGADDITGNDSANTIMLSGGDDTVAGGAGDDVYDFDSGDNGIDALVELADEGRDWLSFGAAEAPLVLCLSTADPQY